MFCNWLSDKLASEKISASYKNGVLEITIPKKEEAKPKPVHEINIDWSEWSKKWNAILQQGSIFFDLQATLRFYNFNKFGHFGKYKKAIFAG